MSSRQGKDSVGSDLNGFGSLTSRQRLLLRAGLILYRLPAMAAVENRFWFFGPVPYLCNARLFSPVGLGLALSALVSSRAVVGAQGSLPSGPLPEDRLSPTGHPNIPSCQGPCRGQRQHRSRTSGFAGYPRGSIRVFALASQACRY